MSQRDKQQLQLLCSDFVTHIKYTLIYINRYQINNVYNADEGGFNLEIYSDHMLAYRSEKTIEASTQSVLSMTHTIQYS